ncbi:tRNA (cytidine(34)-2'-O)-methyltransferase [Spirochaeta africana]|uniref:Putative tRNA (cytidine(34)-2'-O)-methyltransferase n=1 Tax=Spirochaeta africana (strain ATCC 700263 / DSM 8902 / Z-7692) TaxID=889378 RepID=H9UK41_SPIAZ|nr:tRNA (cytidine(34)-2'-O)-methyltransferase [Spirochaeta africana]AFG37884.1 putative rRNA methylase SpoU family [Spirochaeta africana DSM 8902]
MQLNLVLVEPEIPQNTGNIARTCAAVGARLHLVKPMGFTITDKHLKRAGLDYWHLVDLQYHESLEEFLDVTPAENCIFATTKGGQVYADLPLPDSCYLVFGKETAGLPRWLLERYRQQAARIPMRPEARSLNLSNSAAIMAYDVLRRWGFPDLQCTAGKHEEVTCSE